MGRKKREKKKNNREIDDSVYSVDEPGLDISNIDHYDAIMIIVQEAAGDTGIFTVSDVVQYEAKIRKMIPSLPHNKNRMHNVITSHLQALENRRMIKRYRKQKDTYHILANKAADDGNTEEKISFNNTKPWNPVKSSRQARTIYQAVAREGGTKVVDGDDCVDMELHPLAVEWALIRNIHIV